MPEIELTRDADDKHRWTLTGYGELVFDRGMFATGATVTAADGATWELERSTFSAKAKALDAEGEQVAVFEPKGMFSRGGEIVTGGRTWALRPASNWKTRYALADGETELAHLETAGWSGRRIEVDVEAGAEVPGAVMLMACWLVRSFGDDSSAATAATV